LEAHLDAGAILSLEKELEFMTKRQSDIKCEMLNIQTEIKSLVPSHLPFPQLVDQLRARRNNHELQTLSISGAKSLIQTHQHDLSLLYLTRERYDDCLNRLTDASFESLSLSNLLTDESLRPRFEKIESLHRHLSDHQNWSVKEREQLLVELEAEKQFVARRLIYLKEGTFLQEKILKARITSLENNLLYLLLDSLAQVENSLATLSQQAAHLPQKWLNEQKIELHTKIYTEMIESITKIIEAKNIDYNLDYLLASSFKHALPPILPNSPDLFLGIFVGGGVGLSLALFALTFYIIWRGPSASSTNLISQGYQVIPTKEQTARLGFSLAECGSIILIASQTTRSFLPSLTKWFSKRGEKVFLIDFSSALVPPFMIGEERSAYLTSRRFQDLLVNYKTSYDRILIISNAPLESFEIKLLSSHVDGIVCGITSERLAQVKALPEHTFFLMIDRPQPFPLTEIGPKLESLIKRMTSSSFASKPYAWKHFFAKKL
jgi:hypothetical protein